MGSTPHLDVTAELRDSLAAERWPLQLFVDPTRDVLQGFSQSSASAEANQSVHADAHSEIKRGAPVHSKSLVAERFWKVRNQR
jgi:hypothetical protein